ncbi:MAG: hypothetical protein ABFD52_08965 [Acidobacteriota bacterium]
MSTPASNMIFPEESPAPAAGAPFPAKPEPKAITAIVARSSSALDKARALVIKTQEDLTAADLFRQDIMGLLKSIDETFDPQISRAHALHKSLLEEKKKFADLPNQALDIIKPKIADYLQEQDRLRFQAEREAELKRQEAKRLTEKAVDKAWELVDQDKAGEAEDIVQKAGKEAEAIQATAPAIPEKPMANVSLRELWDFEIVDVDKIPRKYMVPDLVTIGKVVRAMKHQTDIPGIRAIKKTAIADKGSRK